MGGGGDGDRRVVGVGLGDAVPVRREGRLTSRRGAARLDYVSSKRDARELESQSQLLAV